MKKMLTIAAAGTLVLAACGSDSGGGGSSSDAKDKLFDEIMSVMSEDEVEGIEIDEDCMRDLVNDIPDDEAELLADNIDEPDLPDGVSEETEDKIVNGMFDCVDFDVSALTDE